MGNLSASLCAWVLATPIALLEGAALRAQPLPLPPPLRCAPLNDALTRATQQTGSERRHTLADAEAAVAENWAARMQAHCYSSIADLYADVGDYRAETLHERAAQLAPDDPGVLEAVARYYRIFRGSRGLFAESERYYLRATATLDRGLEPVADPSADAHRRDQILRGRVDLNRNEGIGLRVPHTPDATFGAYFATDFTYGDFAVPQSALVRDLLTPPPPMPTPAGPPPGPPGSPPPSPPGLTPQDLLRKPTRLRTGNRLRLRDGDWPYIDVLWARTEETGALLPPPATPAPGALPASPASLRFDDVVVQEVGVGFEDTVGCAPRGDLLWSVNYLHQRVEPQARPPMEIDSVRGHLAWTRNLGRVKADVGPIGGITFNGDYEAGAELRLVQFLSPRMFEEAALRRRTNDYVLRYVRRTSETPEGYRVSEDAVAAAARLLDLLPRTDLMLGARALLQSTRSAPAIETGAVELRIAVITRVIERLLLPDRPRADAFVAIARTAGIVEYFEDLSVRGPASFDSRGVAAGFSIDVFSAPLSFTSIVLDAGYEFRDYHRLGQSEHYPRVALRSGFGPP